MRNRHDDDRGFRGMGGFDWQELDRDHSHWERARDEDRGWRAPERGVRGREGGRHFRSEEDMGGSGWSGYSGRGGMSYGGRGRDNPGMESYGGQRQPQGWGGMDRRDFAEARERGGYGEPPGYGGYGGQREHGGPRERGGYGYGGGYGGQREHGGQVGRGGAGREMGAWGFDRERWERDFGGRDFDREMDRDRSMFRDDDEEARAYEHRARYGSQGAYGGSHGYGGSGGYGGYGGESGAAGYGARGGGYYGAMGGRGGMDIAGRDEGWGRDLHGTDMGFGAREEDDRERGPHYGRGPKGYRRSDERIREDVCEALADQGHIDASDVDVKVEGGTVILSGTVAERRHKRALEHMAERCRGVSEVHNELRLRREDQGRSSQGATHGSHAQGQNQDPRGQGQGQGGQGQGGQGQGGHRGQNGNRNARA
jgi:osmotically-inducible protein OsmY